MLTVLLSLLGASVGHTQNESPLPGEQPDGGAVLLAPPGVYVSPDGGTAPSRTAFTSGHSALFTVSNNTGEPAFVEIGCSATGTVTCTGTSTQGLTIPTGGKPKVTAYYNVGQQGTGSIRLTAWGPTNSDQGSFNVTVTAPGGKPGLVLRNHNGTNRDRSLCLTSDAGEGAAWQCGDLLIAHGMPGFTTMGKERSPTLIYNSAQAAPRAAVYATVTQGGTLTAPSSVYTELRVNGVLRDSATFAAWGTGGSQPKQIGLSYDASSDSSGIYPFTLMVRNIYTGATYDTTVSGQLLVVNRAASQYGRGWSIVGVEQLVLGQPGNTILWLGGDGSAKVYTPAGTNRWLAPAGAFQDELVLTNGNYERRLRHGVTVTFHSSGRHIRTTNRQKQPTVFNWNTGYSRLESIDVPPQGRDFTHYTLAYDANGKLDYIADPVGRRLEVSVTGGLLSTLVDADNHSTSFTYPSHLAPGLIGARINRRGFQTLYGWNGWRLQSVAAPYDESGSSTAATAFFAWDAKGISMSAGRTTPVTAADTTLAYTEIQGPRVNIDDNSKFWVDRWGAPTRIENALGYTTQITRGDPGHPALVTKVTHPNGRIDSMTYTARGNLSTTRVITSHLPNGRPTNQISYAYADSIDNPDAPSAITDALNRTTTYQYNSWGLTERTQDPRGHVTTFHHRVSSDTATLRGVLDSVVEQNVLVWMEQGEKDTVVNITQTFGYNPRGNVATTSNFGIGTLYVLDSIGRVTEHSDAFSRKRYFTYDVMNRQTDNAFSGYAWPYTPGCPVKFFTCGRMLAPESWSPTGTNHSSYWSVAGLDSVTDARSVPRHYRYDAMGRISREIDEFGQARIQYFGPSGQLDSTLSRSGMLVKQTYDVLGRQRLLIYPDRPGQPTWSGISSSVTVPGDTVETMYDLMNNPISMTTATNTITRAYYPDGLLRADVFSDGTKKDSLYYEYDASGARTRTVYNYWDGASWTRDVVDYVYAANGELHEMRVTWQGAASPDVFTFAWDDLGRRKTLTYPNSVATVDYRYDPLGVLRKLESQGQQNFDVTFRNRTVDRMGLIWHQSTECGRTGDTDGGTACTSYGGIENQYNLYSWGGNLIRQDRSTSPPDSMAYDKSGNMVWRKNGGDGIIQYFTVPAGTNRMTEHSVGSGFVTDVYNLDGARQKETPVDAAQLQKYRWYYYDGLGRTRGTKWAELAVEGYTWHDDTDCRYDAVGRLVKACENGSQLFYEGHNVVGTYSKWRFIHGPGLDDPLIALNRQSPMAFKLYFVTDGKGRRLAVGNDAGEVPNDVGTRAEWRQSGAVESGHGFDASRITAPGGGLDGVSFFRNRAYDSRTGRWTQEDPIGLAGGSNLYQFNSNNPVGFTDPFGLCPEEMKEDTEQCQKWNNEQAQQAQKIVQEEAAAGNPHALPQTMDVTAYNAEQVRPICTKLGAPSDHACSDGNTMVVNADDGAAAISAFIVHEEQHSFGRSQSGPGSRPAGEQCANKRHTQYVSNMSNAAHQTAARANSHIQATSNPNYPGCGF